MAEAGGLLESREVEASLDNIVRPQLKIYLCAYVLVYTHMCVHMHNCVYTYVFLHMYVCAWM